MSKDYDTLPPVESYVDGGVVSGLPVVLTAGRFAIIQDFGVAGFAVDGAPTIDDVFAAFFVCVEGNLSKAVDVSRNPEKRDRALKRWQDGFTFRKARVASEFVAWFRSQMDCLPDAGDGPSGDSRTWLDRYVDAFASQYGWSRHFILWEFPFVAGIRYQERIAVRIGASSGVSDVTQDAIETLERLEAEREASDGTQG